MQFCALKTCPALAAGVNMSDMYKLTFAAFSFKESKAMSKMQSEKLYNNLICKQPLRTNIKQVKNSKWNTKRKQWMIDEILDLMKVKQQITPRNGLE